MHNLKPITIRFPEPTYTALVEQARADGSRSLSSVVRKIVDDAARQDIRIKSGGDASPFEVARG